MSDAPKPETAAEDRGPHLRDWLRWKRGRQQTGYDKLLLFANPFLVPFDLYVLRFPVGSEVPPHRDPSELGKHYRLNVILRRAASGGEFVCSDTILDWPRVKLFRSDLATHQVTRVEGRPRYVLSLGWILGRRT